jgi:hypothetical protein
VSEQQGSPGRYQRTTQGLVASMVVTVLVVVAVFLFLRLDNGAAEQGPTTVDYTEAVDAARDAGVTVVHPASLPEGWRATSVELVPPPRSAWGIGMLTADGTFAGVRQEADSLDDLLDTYVDEDAQQGDDATFDSPVATTWTTWTDDGGDTAYATQLDVDGEQQTVLVYGSATPADLGTLLESLVVG